MGYGGDEKWGSARSDWRRWMRWETFIANDTFWIPILACTPPTRDEEQTLASRGCRLACPEQEETTLPLASRGPHDSPQPRTSRTPLASRTTTIGIKHGESFLEVCHLVFAESVWPHGFRMNLLCTSLRGINLQAKRVKRLTKTPYGH